MTTDVPRNLLLEVERKDARQKMPFFVNGAVYSIDGFFIDDIPHDYLPE
jgi:hypothetical protein